MASKYCRNPPWHTFYQGLAGSVKVTIDFAKSCRDFSYLFATNFFSIAQIFSLQLRSGVHGGHAITGIPSVVRADGTSPTSSQMV